MERGDFLEFTEYLEELNPDGFILAGDIAEAGSVAGFLRKFRERLDCPIYFILGNHDFWAAHLPKREHRYANWSARAQICTGFRKAELFL